MSSFSVIICTIRRPELYSQLLDSLAEQTFRSIEGNVLEVLIVGREGEPAPALPEYAGLPIRFIGAPKGLAPARNAGLARATGEFIAFLDDDVTIGPTFLEEACRVFGQPGHENVGGLTGFDSCNYGSGISLRWKLRKALGITPSLEPGDASRLGRSVTLAFFQEFSGCREVRWIPGFCQIFRRSAIEGLRYDEKIVVEDRDFAMEVGRRWRLLICGDLRLEHRMDGEARHSQAFQTWRAAFGLGRSFAKRSQSWRDRVTAVHVAAGELLIDGFVLLRQPRWNNVLVAWSRMRGFLAGYASWSDSEPAR